MTKVKTKRFQEFSSFRNSIEYTDELAREQITELLGQYDEVIIELAAGKADLSVELAKRNPKKLYLAIDIQGERLWKGAKYASENNIENIYFVRMYIEDLLEYFPEKSINEIWITFPDPFPKDRHAKRRLSSPRFLDIYSKVIKENGVMHFKTDDLDLFEYTLDTLAEYRIKDLQVFKNIYTNKVEMPELYIQTDFEKKHLAKGKTINYLQFQFE